VHARGIARSHIQRSARPLAVPGDAAANHRRTRGLEETPARRGKAAPFAGPYAVAGRIALRQKNSLARSCASRLCGGVLAARVMLRALARVVAIRCARGSSLARSRGPSPCACSALRSPLALESRGNEIAAPLARAAPGPGTARSVSALAPSRACKCPRPAFRSRAARSLRPSGRSCRASGPALCWPCAAAPGPILAGPQQPRTPQPKNKNARAKEHTPRGPNRARHPRRMPRSTRSGQQDALALARAPQL